MTEPVPIAGEVTARVRVVRLGARTLTATIYRQLDAVDPWRIEPFGRVRDPRATSGPHVVGVDRVTGDLVRSRARRSDETRNWSHLPLIVLAGLR
jgi:hypothetical protein